WRSFQSFVFVVSARPTVGVVAPPLRGAVEQLPGCVQDVRAAVVARVGVVDEAVLERERAQAVKLVAPEVDLRCVLRRPEVEAGAGLLPLFREYREVEVEVVSRGRDPREAPAHPAPVGLQVLERGTRNGDEGHAARREMDDGAVETVRSVRAPWTA